MGDFFGILAKSWFSLLVVAVVSYLLGSLNSAIIVTKLMARTDIRNIGSGNAGTTNVLRSQGKKAALFTTVGDLGKSILAVLLGGLIMSAMNPSVTGTNLNLIGTYFAGLVCVLGHLYPLYFGFRGGKGIMATLGMMLALDWRVALICLGVFILVVLISKMVSLGSICAAASLPIVTFLFKRFVDKTLTGDIVFCVIMTGIVALILVLKHKDNIKRLINGTERKLTDKKEEAKN